MDTNTPIQPTTDLHIQRFLKRLSYEDRGLLKVVIGP